MRLRIVSRALQNSAELCAGNHESANYYSNAWCAIPVEFERKVASHPDFSRLQQRAAERSGRVVSAAAKSVYAAANSTQLRTLPDLRKHNVAAQSLLKRETQY